MIVCRQSGSLLAGIVVPCILAVALVACRPGAAPAPTTSSGAQPTSVNAASAAGASKTTLKLTGPISGDFVAVGICSSRGRVEVDIDLLKPGTKTDPNTNTLVILTPAPGTYPQANAGFAGATINSGMHAPHFGVTFDKPGAGTITVNSDLSGQIDAMLPASAADTTGTQQVAGTWTCKG